MEPKNMKKAGRTMSEYLLHIKALVDALASIGNPNPGRAFNSGRVGQSQR